MSNMEFELVTLRSRVTCFTKLARDHCTKRTFNMEYRIGAEVSSSK